ncbi:MAG: DUF2975 domain-containing protein [Parvularculaceae bacterium]|nr:DUF2975 domain-containing protein [Parvularculaceae bacterium]
MKAIGKYSLASILAWGLYVARVVIFSAFVGLSIAAVFTPLLPFIAPALDDLPGVSVSNHLDLSGGDYVEIMNHFVTFGVMLFIVNRLLEILRTLRLGSPFAGENAERFRQVGFALLLGEGAKVAFLILGGVFDADVDLNFEFITWIAMAAVLVLAEVFRQGAKMKEEQDLTV